MTSHPDEGTLHAYIDGELPSSEAAALELHLHDCERCAAGLAEARGFVAAASRTINALDAAPSGTSTTAAGVAKAPPPQHGRPRRAFHIPFARAAALLLLAGGTAVVVNRSGPFDAGDGASESASFLRSDAPTLEEIAELRAPAESPEPASVAAPRAQIQAALPTEATNPARANAVRDLSATTTAGTGTDAALKNAAPGRASAGVAGGTARGAVVGERAVAPAAAQVGGAEPAPAAQPRRSDGVVADAAVLPPPPPPPTAPPAVGVEPSRESALAMTGAAAPVRVTRLRTQGGVVLTLTDEPIRASFAENANAARRSVLRPMQTSTRSAEAGAASPTPPVMNSYRWTSAEQGRTYTLTGPLTVAELEAAARRLGELERVP